MIGFQYQYSSHEEILSRVGSLSSQSWGELMMISGFLIAFLMLSVFFLPSIILWYKDRLTEKEKISKKRLLTQILLQKEIENEVEKEIQLEEQSKSQS